MTTNYYRDSCQFQCIETTCSISVSIEFPKKIQKKKRKRNWEDKDKIDRKSDSIREKKKFWKEEGKEEEGEEDKREKNHIVSR